MDESDMVSECLAGCRLTPRGYVFAEPACPIKKHRTPSRNPMSVICIIILCDSPELVCYVREQCYDAGTLYCCGQLSLVLSACAGDSLGEDLASLSNVLLQFLYVLVIDGLCLIGTELANLASSHAAVSSIHYQLLLSLEWDVF